MQLLVPSTHDYSSHNEQNQEIDFMEESGIKLSPINIQLTTDTRFIYLTGRIDKN